MRTKTILEMLVDENPTAPSPESTMPGPKTTGIQIIQSRIS